MADVLEPRQQRSRDTHARLMKAAVEVLNAHGLDGATIPRIAKVAGLSPASVYRRFRDKDALLRTVFLEIIQGSGRQTRERVRREAFADPTLDGIASELIRMLIRQHREYGGVLRALMRFAEHDEELRTLGLAATAENFGVAVDMLAGFSGEIHHPEPRRAITFALLSVGTCIEARILEPMTLWNELYAASDDELCADLAEMLLAYLRYPPSAR